MNIDELAEKIAEDSDNPRIIEVWVRKGIVAGVRASAHEVLNLNRDRYTSEIARAIVIECAKQVEALIPKEASNG